MGLTNFIKNELVEVIDWLDNTQNTLSHKFVDSDCEIKNGAQLIVRESQAAQFAYLGVFGDVFGPGKYRLTTDNLPILTTLKSWHHGFNSPFKSDVYFVSTKLFLGNKWGTPNAIILRDRDFGVLRIRAFGSFDFRITNVQTFLRAVVGTNQTFYLEEFIEFVRPTLVSLFSDTVASLNISALDLASQYAEIGAAVLPTINAMIGQNYGVELTLFNVQNISLPPEVEAAVDKRTSMNAIGNLSEYTKFQIVNDMEGQGVHNQSGIAGFATELSAGLALGQYLSNELRNGMAPTANPQPGSSSSNPQSNTTISSTGIASLPEILTPADVARFLGVPEADIQASIESGELKSKKIGGSYRITKSALEEFLKS